MHLHTNSLYNVYIYICTYTYWRRAWGLGYHCRFWRYSLQLPAAVREFAGLGGAGKVEDVGHVWVQEPLGFRVWGLGFRV